MDIRRYLHLFLLRPFCLFRWALLAREFLSLTFWNMLYVYSNFGRSLQAGERRNGKSKFLVPGWGPRVPLFQLCVGSTRVEEFILKFLRTIVIFEFLWGLVSLLQLSSWNLRFFFNFRVSLSVLLVYFDAKVKEIFLELE